MAVQSNIWEVSSTKTYHATKPIPTKQHMAVWARLIDDGQIPTDELWVQVSVEQYDLISNSAVISEDFDLLFYTHLEIRVADTPDEITTTPAPIAVIAPIVDEIVIVADIVDEVIIVADIATEVVVVAGMEDAIQEIVVDPLKTAILNAEVNAGRAEDAADRAEAIEQDVIDEGNIQVARVVAEGDTQTARVIAYADEAEDFNGEAEAEALNSDQWANAPLETDVIEFTWDSVNDTMTQAPIPNARSAFHWKEMAKLSGSGLHFQGFWDSVACSIPPTPIPDAGELANGFFYIVQTVSGDTALCPELGVGDWIVWSGDLDGDATVEGAWELVNWTFDWTAITGVTVAGNAPSAGDDLLPTTGGTMTGQLKGITPVDAEDLTRKDYVDGLITTLKSENDDLKDRIAHIEGLLNV